MRNKIFFIILTVFFSNNLRAVDILFSPISKCNIYSNISDDLFPFVHSIKTAINSDTKLLLLDEIESNNELYGDILRVKIVSSVNNGVIGYIPEENVFIRPESIREGVNVVYKNDKNNTRLRLISSRLTYDGEMLVMVPEQTWNNYQEDEEIRTTNKDNIRFVVSKTKEIEYYLHKGFDIIKCVDTRGCIPVKDVEIVNSGDISDEFGFIFTKIRDNVVVLRKNGYIPNYFDRKEKISLVFMEELNRVKLSETGITTHKVGNNNIVIKDNGRGKSEIYINALHNRDYSEFVFPTVDDEWLGEKRVVNGFYVETIGDVEIDFSSDIVKADMEILFFDVEMYKWSVIGKIDAGSNRNIRIVNDGYYLCVDSTNYPAHPPTQHPIESDSNNYMRLVSSKNGEVGLYEAVGFDRKNPYTIKKVKVQNRNGKVEYNDRSVEIKEPRVFDDVYYNKWNRIAIKESNEGVDIKHFVEHLGDMTLIKPNIVKFNADNTEYCGFFDIIDDNRVLIHITNISRIILSNNRRYRVDSSVFSSELVIPAYYSVILGVFELSFDAVYIYRRSMAINGDFRAYYDDDGVILATDGYFHNNYPQDRTKSKYKVYFSYF